jgi:hypothetical protein
MKKVKTQVDITLNSGSIIPKGTILKSFMDDPEEELMSLIWQGYPVVGINRKNIEYVDA